ncbi:hypothetical protein CLV36_104196 [Laceyella sediminis]|jgi:hypothetical protein|uniref:Uncharacterized protein n=1 Tax=Laceyella sediminis TaxID=573074 RepID=A0ABX5EQB5_9BACL|nr:hypothetical protein CLV36_104196 [Laceyella sediminis]
MGQICYIYLSKPNGKPFILKLTNAVCEIIPTGYLIKAGKSLEKGGEEHV